MRIHILPLDFTVCKLRDVTGIDLGREYYYLAKTDEEISLVCGTQDVPENTLEREDGWRGFRLQGILDFSLIGILARISTLMAEQDIGIFAVSTYNTDYIFVKKENFRRALETLEENGYTVE